jgi:hypothetical protein
MRCSQPFVDLRWGIWHGIIIVSIIIIIIIITVLVLRN